jgi:hypothetical protein
MAKNGYDQTYEDDKKENEETANLLPRAGRAIAKTVKKVYDAATSKGKDFEPKMTSHGDVDFVDTSAVRSPVSGTGQDVRSLNMGTKSKTPKPSDMMKKGGVVKRSIDGCAIRGKTRAK